MLSGYFFDPSKGVAVATNVVGKIDYQSTRMTFVRAVPPASLAAGIRQERQLLCRAKANKLPESVDAGKSIN